MTHNELNDLELSVLECLLRGDDEISITLRKQLDHITVSRREHTGAGFFTHVKVDPGAPRVHGSARLRGVFAEISGLDHGAGFLVTVADGRIRTIEGFSYEEAWPDRIDQFEVHPAEDDSPDLSGLEPRD